MGKKTFTTKLNSGFVDVSYDIDSDGDLEGMTVELDGINVNPIVSAGDFEDLEMECYAHFDKEIADNREYQGMVRYEDRMAA